MLSMMANINPESVLLTASHRGYKFAILHNGMGYRCGYVCVPRGHKWYGVHDCTTAAQEITCHGGVTYGNYGVSDDGNTDKSEWWIGFDCGHVGDAQDEKLLVENHPCDFNSRTVEEAHLLLQIMRRLNPGGTIKDTEYVKQQCISLCEQAHAATLPEPELSDG